MNWTCEIKTSPTGEIVDDCAHRTSTDSQRGDYTIIRGKGRYYLFQAHHRLGSGTLEAMKALAKKIDTEVHEANCPCFYCNLPAPDQC